MIRILIALFIFICSNTEIVSAEKFTIEADGYHTVSRKESIAFAEKAATDDALKWAVEQIGIRISAYSEVVNKVLQEDDVQRFSSSVIEVKNITLTPQVDDDNYKIYAHVICVVDTEALDKWEPPHVVRQRILEEDKARLEEENKMLEKGHEQNLSQIMIEEKKKEQQQLKLLRLKNKEKLDKVEMWINTGYSMILTTYYAGAPTEDGEKTLIEAWKMSKELGFPNQVAMERLAALEWNRKNYNKFYEYLRTTSICERHEWLDNIDKWKPGEKPKIDFHSYKNGEPKEYNGLVSF